MRYMIKMHPTLDILVDTLGRVFLPKSGNHPARWTNGCRDNVGYCHVRIEKRLYTVHRLVAETFIPNTLGKPTVDHINRDPSDNSVSNLRWATYSEQQRNQTRTENALKKYGVRCIDSKLEYMRARYAYAKENAA